MQYYTGTVERVLGRDFGKKTKAVSDHKEEQRTIHEGCPESIHPF
jgi:hypothetical protein